jgi:hypothetical protein
MEGTVENSRFPPRRRFSTNISQVRPVNSVDAREPAMIRRVIRTLRSWTWWKWGLFGLLMAALLQVLIVAEFWRERCVVTAASKHGVSFSEWPVFSETPLWRIPWVQANCQSIALPTDASYRYEADVAPDVISQLRWLPALRSLSFGDRWSFGSRRNEFDRPPPPGRFVGDDDLMQVGRLTQLRRLHFKYSNITDEGLRHLTGLQSLTDLELTRTNITDAGLVHVGQLRSLVRLNLQQTNVTGTGLTHLRPLKRLTRLNLQVTPLRDGTLEVLAELPALRFLDLDMTPITDASIHDLSKLASLRELSVMSLSEEGMMRLQQALPDCKVMQGPN